MIDAPIRRHRWVRTGRRVWDGVNRNVFKCKFCGAEVLARSDLGPHLAHRELWVSADGDYRELKPFAPRPECTRVWPKDVLAPPPSPPRVRRSVGPIRARRLDQMPALVDELDDEPLPERPRTRGECQGGPRPCPWISCPHHLYLDVLPSGVVLVPHPEVAVWEMTESCVLDLADRGGLDLDDVGDVLNVTRERVRQIEARALSILREGADLDATVLGDDEDRQWGSSPRDFTKHSLVSHDPQEWWLYGQRD